MMMPTAGLNDVQTMIQLTKFFFSNFRSCAPYLIYTLFIQRIYVISLSSHASEVDRAQQPSAYMSKPENPGVAKWRKTSFWNAALYEDEFSIHPLKFYLLGAQ